MLCFSDFNHVLLIKVTPVWFLILAHAWPTIFPSWSQNSLVFNIYKDHKAKKLNKKHDFIYQLFMIWLVQALK